jgi:hypothetical protein
MIACAIVLGLPAIHVLSRFKNVDARHADKFMQSAAVLAGQ